jgi:hypothetical protein
VEEEDSAMYDSDDDNPDKAKKKKMSLKKITEN